MIVCDQFQFDQKADRRHLECSVSHPALPARLYFDCVSDRLEHRDRLSANWALLTLLYPAMALGEDLHIDHDVSDELLFAVNNDVQPLLLTYESGLKRIKVTSSGISEPLRNDGKGVGTGFSAGVDTFTTLQLYTRDDAPGDLRIKYLTTFNVGAMGGTRAAAGLFEKYAERLAGFAGDAGYNRFAIDSNMDDFYQNRLCGFQKTHVIRNAAAAYVFEDMLSGYLYSSTYPYNDILSGHDDMAYIEPLLLPLISTGPFRLFSAGSGLSRLDKMKVIADYPPAFAHLDVCVSNPMERAAAQQTNCSRCWKCTRAMLTLDAIGTLDSFNAVFDLDGYRKNRGYAYGKVVESALLGKPADRDTLEFLKEKNLTVGSYPVVAAKKYVKLKVYSVIDALQGKSRSGSISG